MAATARTPRPAVKPKAPRDRLPPKQRPPGPPDDDDEVVSLDAEPDTEPERVPVFTIRGEVHTMLASPGPSIALRAMELAERRGATEVSLGLADVYIMREMLGENSYRALLNCKTMTRGQYLKIVGRVMRRAMGALEDEDGSPNR